MPTIGVEFATRIVPLQSDIKIKAQIWDTGITTTFYIAYIYIYIN